MPFEVVWETYKEVTAVLGLVAVVLAIWKRRPLLKFLWVCAVVQGKILKAAVQDAAAMWMAAWSSAEGVKNKAGVLVMGWYFIPLILGARIVRGEKKLLSATLTSIRGINAALRE